MIIREASFLDAAGIAKVHVDTWRTAFRGIVSEEYLNQLTYEQLTEHIVTMFRGSNGIFGYVAETQPGEIIGFAAGGPEQSGRSDYRGELYGLFVTENHQRCGVGHRLFDSVAQKLSKMGINSMIVWVFAENPRLDFYEALGGKELGKRMTEIGGKEYAEVAYGWDITMRPV